MRLLVSQDSGFLLDLLQSSAVCVEITGFQGGGSGFCRVWAQQQLQVVPAAGFIQLGVAGFRVLALDFAGFGRSDKLLEVRTLDSLQGSRFRKQHALGFRDFGSRRVQGPGFGLSDSNTPDDPRGAFGAEL
jgi:pimeloyl-ACP methyl ester carboxylesterase